MAVFRTDPCGLLCVFLTYLAVLYADYAVVFWMILPTLSESLWGAFHVAIFNTVLFMLLMSHARAVFSDPGIVSLPQSSIDFSDMYAHSNKTTLEKEDWTVCSRCETYRPPRAHHCRICQRCIRRMDHHCPWINNCVGELNQKYFIQFLFYVGVASIYSVAMVLSSWLKDCKKDCNRDIFYKQHRVVHSVILSIESFLFGIFVFAILCDQFQAILSDETSIEQLQKKGPHRPRKPKLALMAEICGRGPPIMWLLPCHNIGHKVDNLASYDV